MVRPITRSRDSARAMRKWIPLLSWIFDKRAGVTTPLAMKIIAVVQGLVLVNSLVRPAAGPSTYAAVSTLLVWTLSACLMTAL
jgi:hypothetical protein